MTLLIPDFASDALWQALAADAPYHVALVSTEGRLLYLNRSQRLPDPQELVGRLLPDIHPGLGIPAMEAVGRALASGQAERREVQASLGGLTRWFDLHVTPIRNQANLPIWAVLIGHDVTEAKQAGSELRMSVNALHRLVEQREQLSADLHDGILQSLYGVGLRLEAARTAANNGIAAMEPHLDRAVRQLNDTMAEIRRFITDDRTVGSMATQWEVALAGVLRGLEVEGGPDLVLDIHRVAASRVPAALRSELMFIAREAVSNAMRHSGAAQVTVRLKGNESVVRLEIIDNGRGFAPGHQEAGLGLLTMVRRAGQIGAVLTRESTDGQGTLVRLDLPITPSEPQ